MAVHGCPRLTIDVDLLVRPERLNEAKSVLAIIGFDLASTPIQFWAGTANEILIERLIKTQGARFLTLDLIVVTPILQEAWENRQRFRLDQRDLWVVSRAGLIQMKRLANRPQDQADIAELESLKFE